MAAFRKFAAELDTKHDKHERIVKISRDITIESKRLIFSLHSLLRYSILFFIVLVTDSLIQKEERVMPISVIYVEVEIRSI